MSCLEHENLAAMLDVLVYENVLLAWSLERPDGYEVVLHDGDSMMMTCEQVEMWVLGAFATYLAFIDHGRITPRILGG
ncbi:hypothetical protein [Nonomuraea soli]|uniref:Uncharacterized protein n=1 Tax=Nonomuraea soli TaxID=1032476 RepID=A0A7W0CTH8_9ACTN|nr:hypothetical protein [Nonomuraea soli]MBA2897061.1 hypothetical protein [Nonomuraea soli]